MEKNVLKRKRWARRKRGIRKRVTGTADQPRLTVYRSNQQVYAQLIDDVQGRTLVSASSLTLDKGSDTSAAQAVGKQIGEKAREAGVSRVSFDRNGYRYHGRVKALADAAREAGLEF